MATFTHAESRRLYSWWWDSHISPKNSKWLQENLTDMDMKVKSMIKLIEEDADSFARRAEMYYKKRPELMKLVEEFYRAYRALAERYDHATGALRQAHRTMAEAFPNQIPFSLNDDSPPVTSATDGEPQTPEMAPAIRAFFEPDDLQKDDLVQSSHLHAIKRNRVHSEGDDDLTGKKGLKQVNEMFASGDGTGCQKFAEGRVRKSLDFQGEEGKVSEHNNLNGSRVIQKHELGEQEDAFDKIRSLQQEISLMSTENQNLKVQAKSEYERAGKAETEVQRLQAALSRSESEKEAILLQYQQSLEKISNLQTRTSSIQENYRKLNDEMLVKVARLDSATERCLLLEKANEALKLEGSALAQKTNEQQQELQHKHDEMEKLKFSLQDEHLRYMQAEAALQSFEKLHSESLEKLKFSALGTQKGFELLKDIELRKHGLDEDGYRVKEVNSNLLSSNLNEEPKGKHEKLDKPSISIQDEGLLSVQAKESLQSLEKLHHQSQKEIRFLMLSIQSMFDMLRDMQLRKKGLEEEVWQIKEENRNLAEHNLSFALMIKNLQYEILGLKEAQRKLEDEVGLRVDASKALQQELFCLKEEINDLTQKHQGVMEQMEAVGLNKESFQASVKELQDGNLELKQICKKHEDEKILLLEKLKMMEEKNAMLDISLLDANLEIEGLREKIKTLEELCESLHGRNSALISENGVLVLQLETVTRNMEKLLENNTFLENTLSDTDLKLEGLRGKLESSEQSCPSACGENENLPTEKNRLISQVQSISRSLEKLMKKNADLEEKLVYLEREKESTLVLVSELQNLLKLAKDEHENYIQSTQTHLAALEGQVRHLQEEGERMDEELKEEQNRLLEVQMEVFMLQRTLCDLIERNSSLARESEKHLNASICAERLISELQQEILRKKKKAESLCEHNMKLREGIQMILNSLAINDGDSEGPEDHWQLMLCKIRAMQDSITNTLDENQNLLFENLVNITLLQQLGLDVVDLKSEISSLTREFKGRTEELLVVQKEKCDLFQMNRQLRREVRAGYLKEDQLKAKMEKENLFFKETAVKLEECKSQLVVLEYDLNMARNVSEELSCQIKQLNHLIEAGEYQLFQKDLQLVEVNQKFETTEKENEILQKDLAAFRMELDEAMGMKEEWKSKISMLVEGDREKDRSTALIHEANMMLKTELQNLRNKIAELRNSQEHLTYKLMYEVKCYEEEVAALCKDIHISTIHADIYEEKLLELVGECECLEINAIIQRMILEEEIISRNKHIGDLDQKLDELEEENRGLKARLGAYLPLVLSLHNSFASLEDCILSLVKHRVANNQAAKVEPRQHVKSHEQLCGDVNITAPAGVLELEKLQARIEALQGVIQSGSLLMPENLDAYSRLMGASKVGAEELKQERSLDREEIQTNNDVIIMPLKGDERPGDDFQIQQNSAENPEGRYGMMVKDIQLDHVSSSSEYEVGRGTYGMDRIEHAETDDQMLKLWESAEREGGDQVEKAPSLATEIDMEYHKLEALEEEKSEYPSSELVDEKELGVDKLDLPKKFKGSHREWNKKVLERLASDAQSLSLLQTNMQALKGGMENVEKSDHLPSLKYDAMKGQLKEAEEAISQLVDLNSKLTKEAQECDATYDIKAGEQEETGNPRKISEDARRMSKKIVRFELELLRIQNILLKLEEEHQSGSKTARGRRRVLLRDYFYGREKYRRRRGHFCNCIQPNTRD